jgi:predicted DNA binding protein
MDMVSHVLATWSTVPWGVFNRIAEGNYPVSVIVELALPAEAFRFGKIFSVEGETSVTLESLVPVGENPVPFVRLLNAGVTRRPFEEQVRASGLVEDLTLVDSHDDEALYALDWDATGDPLISAVRRHDGHILDATGGPSTWWFSVRIPSHDALSSFQADCLDADLSIDVERVYNPTRPDVGAWYGVTALQRESLVRAVEAGYYSIPRGTSTQELADEFGISDQALTERLRRAIVTLVTNTLAAGEAEQEQ